MSEDFRVKVSFLLLECDSGTQHGLQFAKVALALLRMKVFGVADGL
jgi:hypothetical protein